MNVNDYIEMRPGLRGGRPVVKGTGFTVSQLLTELARGRSVDQIADDFQQEVALLRGVLEYLAKSWQNAD